MSVEDIINILKSNKIELVEQKALGNGSGEALKFSGGEIINVYNTGKVVVQGKNAEKVKQLLEPLDNKNIQKLPPKKVFVVYGHDTNARTQLEALLRRWDIEPLILEQLPSEGQTIIEKLENYADKADYAIVLTTPDDEGHVANKADEKQFRARQNVVLELGMMLAKLGRRKVAILIKDQRDMEKPSDINGLMYIPFSDSVEDAKTTLYKELCQVGFKIDPQKL